MLVPNMTIPKKIEKIDINGGVDLGIRTFATVYSDNEVVSIGNNLYKKIEKYQSYLHAEQCPECGFYTFKITKEEVAEKPTDSQPGLLVKHYQCDYCSHREARETKISSLAKNVA